MNVASLELCKELYELSGWKDCEFQYSGWNGDDWRLEHGQPTMLDTAADSRYGKQTSYPAYDLGYLVRKLPARTLIDRFSDAYLAALAVPEFYEARADTPEDAAAKLAIELFKQGVLLAPTTPTEPTT